MLIKFKKIILNNFLSFGYSELDLTDSGYTLVSGINNNKDDLAKSNGSGKSSIWEAISWSLTGKTIRECKDIVNIYADDGAYVELEFSIDSDDYKIMRSKDHSKYKTNLKIYINGEDKSGKGIKDSEKLLVEYIPDLTSTLLGSVIILGQGLPQRFSNNTPSGRKDVLETLSKSDFMINDIKDKLTTRKNAFSIELRGHEDNLLISNSKLSDIDRAIINNRDKYASYSSTDFNTVLQPFYDKQIKIAADLKELEIVLNERQQALFNYHSKYQELRNAEIEALSQISVARTSELSDYKVNLTKLESELTTAKAELKKMQSIKDICPTCGQKLPNITKPDTTELEQYIVTLNESIVKVKHSIESIDDKYDELKISTTLKYSCDSSELESTVKEMSKLADETNHKFMELRNQESNTKLTIAKYEEARDNTVRLLTELEAEKIRLEQDKQELSDRILYINNIKEETQKRLEIVNKMYMIAIRDFRGFLLTNIIEFINRKSKEYSLDIFETDKIEFILEGNYINIFYDNKQYENLSGGEKQKVDLIVQFSIRDMLCKFLNFSSNIIVLDEIFDNLDSLGCQKVLNVISKRLSDIDNIYIVTHHADIDLPIDNEIIVIKNENGISEIKQ